jgi:nitroreductase
MEERHACHSFLGGIGEEWISDVNRILVFLGALVYEIAYVATPALLEIESEIEAIKDASVKTGTTQIGREESFCFRIFKRGLHGLGIVIAAVYDRATRKYGQRGIRYAHMEVGHAAQNVYLQSASLNLGTTLVGAFNDKRVKEVLKLPSDEQPLGLMPVGGR